jgi:GntR family transcriptional regulator
MRLDPGPLPLYHQLEEDLRARIHAKEFETGGALPTEEQLCAQYGVSRITVRRALDALIAQGLIVRRRGVGSFVAESKAGVRSVKLAGSLDEFLAASGTLENQIVTLTDGIAPPEVAALLGLEKGARVTRLDALSLLKDAPIGFLNIYFPQDVGAQLTRADLEGASPIIRLVERKLNIRIARAEQMIEPDRAGAVAARHLDIDPDTPVLRVTRVYYTAFDRPVEVALIRYHPQRYRYSIDFRSDTARR